MAFKHLVSFATDLAAYFGCNQFRIMQEIVSYLLPTAQCRWLLCTEFNSEHADMFLCLIFTQRPINEQNIEQSHEYSSWSNKCSLNPSKFHFNNRNGIPLIFLVMAQEMKWKSFDSLTKSVKQQWQYVFLKQACCCQLTRNQCVCSCSFDLPKQCWALPKCPSHWFWSQGAQPWAQTWTLLPDQQVLRILSALKSLHKLCGVWILFKVIWRCLNQGKLSKYSLLKPQVG